MKILPRLAKQSLKIKYIFFSSIAKNLKKLRATRGMSQEYLADESRVSLRTIQRIENNESEPTGETIKRIAIAYLKN